MSVSEEYSPRLGLKCEIYDAASGWLGIHTLLASLIILFSSVSLRYLMISRADLNELVANSDAATYFVPAEKLIDRGAFLDHRGRPMIDRTPGYPAFLASIMLLVGRELRNVLLVQTILLSFGPLILYWLARRSVPPVPAFAAGLIAAFSPWGAVLAVAPMSDGLFLFLLTGIFFLMKLIQGLSWGKSLLGFASIGALTGMAVLVRPISPLIILVGCALVFFYGFRSKGVWLLIATNLVFATLPVVLWTQRNEREAQFNGISDIAGRTVWLYLAARVRAEVAGQSRYEVSVLAHKEEQGWGFPVSSREADDERWQRSKAIFQQHPFLTVYSFARSAFEHAIHPSPDVLRAVNLYFPGGIVVLAILWGGLLVVCAYALIPPPWGHGSVDWRLLWTMLIVSATLTLSSGISFAAASRLRAPMETIVPLLAATGLWRGFRRITHSTAY